MIRRTGAREGTCLEDGAFDVVFAQGFQSPPMSDAEDPDTVVVLVPEYLIDEVSCYIRMHSHAHNVVILGRSDQGFA